MASVETSPQSMTVRPIIGMEVHVQLATKTKLFCNCAVEFGAAPNSRMCPVCLGMPGVLPVMNRRAFEMAVQLGLALNCKIAPFTKWDRKSYFYPDLPKNYQISQYDLPLASEGWFEIDVQGQRKRIRIRRAHLEEDAGKNIHDASAWTLVDLNRAGTPLLEIVTEPDLNSAEEAYAFAVELQRLVTYMGISEGVMQKGQMRFEPNVNVAITVDGKEYRTPIAEVKNLNSFKSVRGAIEYETRRQADEWRRDSGYVFKQRSNENRGWDDQREVTEFQRAKEAAHDYRYFPDPDLVPVEVSPAWLEELRRSIPELPLARRDRLMRDAGLSERDADVVLADRGGADLFDAVLAAGAPGPLFGKQYVNVWSKLAADRSISPASLGVPAVQMASLTKLISNGVISAGAAGQMADNLIKLNKQPPIKSAIWSEVDGNWHIAVDALAKQLDLIKEQDVGLTETWVRQAIEANPQAVAEVLSGSKKAKASEGFLRGAVMKLSGGKADGKLVGELIQKLISEMPEKP